MSAHAAYGRRAESRQPQKAASEDRPGVIAPAPILYAMAFLAGVLLHGVFPKPILPLDIAPLTAVGLLGCGAALAVWSRRALESAGTNVNPSLPATTLVVTGPFGFSRNPMYVARTFLYLGLGLMVNALGTLVALVPLLLVMHYGVIKPEERYLECKFGDAYRQYRTRVRRWL
jgi:protein-S-isoprenylcysteine O-methyltransferase Ste14